MTGKTHMAGGLFVGVIISQQAGLDLKDSAIVTTVSVVGSLLPDIDTTQSKMGRALLPLSIIVSVFVGHRKLTHSLFLWPSLGLIAYAAFPEYWPYVLGCVTGCISHVILDAFTAEGVPIFYPFPKKFSLIGVKTGGVLDIGLGVALIMAAGAIGYQMFA
jgi:inner membrane protein